MDRLRAILDSAEELPPAHIMLYAIARSLGVVGDKSDGAEASGQASAEAFVGMFGGSGSL